MTLKAIDHLCDYALWLLFALLALLSWFGAESLTAPEFDTPETDFSSDYTFIAPDGDRVYSTYTLAWHYTAFSSGTAVLYDKQYDRYYDIKTEYYSEMEAKLPPSRYGWWQNMFWVYFIVLAIVSALAAYCGGGYIRDFILSRIALKHDKFEDSAYFLHGDRFCGTDAVKKNIPRQLSRFVALNSDKWERKYSPSFYRLIMKMLSSIARSGDTEILFIFSFFDDTKQHADFLKELSAYWASRIGSDPKAEEHRDYIDSLRNTRYEKITVNVSAETICGNVSRQMNDLFTEIMGGEVFRMEAGKSLLANYVKTPGQLFVVARACNSLKTFDWNGSSRDKIPGVRLLMSIYHYVNGQKVVLWEQYLEPVCTYTASDEDFSLAALYEDMIKETINTFTKSLKK